jgi:hypothetical protein
MTVGEPVFVVVGTLIGRGLGVGVSVTTTFRSRPTALSARRISVKATRHGLLIVARLRLLSGVGTGPIAPTGRCRCRA